MPILLVILGVALLAAGFCYVKLRRAIAAYETARQAALDNLARATADVEVAEQKVEAALDNLAKAGQRQDR